MYVTTDGGKNWRKSLYVDDHTGAIDVAMQPGNGQVLFAATWQAEPAGRGRSMTAAPAPGSGARRTAARPGSGCARVCRRAPSAASASRSPRATPQRVYALLETAIGKGTLFATDDLGDHWHQVSDNHAYNVRGFYFTTLEVAPDDPDRVYFLGFQLAESDDGGKTAHVIDEAVHVDHHAMWIDPTNPKRMIQGNDGGAYLSQDGGKSWRFLDGLPIEQTYMVAADSRSPYDLCTGLQDNSGWCGPSSALADNVVSGQDWFTVVGGDGEYAVPAPSDPNIIYADAEDGAITAVRPQDQAVAVHHAVSAWPRVRRRSAHLRAEDPLQLDAADRSRSAGREYGLHRRQRVAAVDRRRTNWKTISPDLTRNDKSKQQLSGGPIHYDLSGAETYDTLLSIQVAQSDPRVIWVGSDDGLVSVTRDGGNTWSKVTPPRAPAWARVYQIDVSPTDPGTAYVAIRRARAERQQALCLCDDATTDITGARSAAACRTMPR